MVFAVVGSVGIIATAVYQSLKSRVVRWDALLFALVLLLSLPWGIRNYGPELADATIDLLSSMAGKRQPMEEAIKAFIGDDIPGGDEQVNVPQPTPWATPTPYLEPTVNSFEATATVYFQDMPTPTPTPRPMIEPTSTQPPAPTVFICRTSEDVLAGCHPPTPSP
jgi:hypothetical protein